jgi:Spy/CpxP family protein refolding chaperone
VFIEMVRGALVGIGKDLNMVRLSNKFLAVIAAVAIVALAAQLAVAQNEEGRRNRSGRGGGPGGFGGPPSMAGIARIPKVQEALKLTDEQKSKIEKLGSDFRKEMREALDGGRPDPEKMKKLRDSQTEKMKEVLNADQQKRLMGIFIQLMGAGAVMDPAVGKEIGLTDEQKDKLHEAMGSPPEGRGGRDGGRERRAKMEKEVMAVLTPEQQKKLESLKGEKVDIDMSALRGPGGGREGRGRDRGNRGEPKESKDSKSSS